MVYQDRHFVRILDESIAYADDFVLCSAFVKDFGQVVKLKTSIVFVLLNFSATKFQNLYLR